MTDEQLIARFTEMQEHPERWTDGQLQDALGEGQMQELVEQMAFAKRAFRHEDAQGSVPPVEQEWARFAASHPERQPSSRAYKVAASFVGLLVASGIAIAAINLVRSESSAPAKTEPAQTAAPSTPAVPSATDTVAAAPRVFDNTTLETMLTEIAAAHHTTVTFRNEDARGLRFHFVWKREDSLRHTVEKLNTFEVVDIVIENERLIVR